jgi:hypothetical protein
MVIDFARDVLGIDVKTLWPQTIKILRMLQDSHADVIFLRGEPGSGKTQASVIWLCWVAHFFSTNGLFDSNGKILIGNIFLYDQVLSCHFGHYNQYHNKARYGSKHPFVRTTGESNKFLGLPVLGAYFTIHDLQNFNRVLLKTRQLKATLSDEIGRNVKMLVEMPVSEADMIFIECERPQKDVS